MKAFILVGTPGAGKTTYAEELAKEHNAVVISGDDIRTELYGCSEFQPNWVEIWSCIEDKVAENVGVPLVMDGTHCRADYRAEVLTLLRSYGYSSIEAFVLNTPLDICLDRNSRRHRVVPEHTVRHMHKSLERSIYSIHNEPFDAVTVIS
jgi:predicted kinase